MSKQKIVLIVLTLAGFMFSGCAKSGGIVKPDPKGPNPTPDSTNPNPPANPKPPK